MAFDNAFIGYRNYFTASSSSLSAVGVSSDFSANSLKNWQAFDYCQFDAGSNRYIQIDCGYAVDIDYFALAAHELFTANCTNITLKGSNVSNFATSTTLATLTLDNAGTPPVYSGSYKHNTNTAIASQTVEDNPVACLKLDSVNFRYYRLTFTCAVAVRIGVIAIGQRLEFELGFYNGAQPPTLNEDVIVTNNKSESGVFLGRSITRIGAKPVTINLDKLSHDWIYTKWLPFKKSAEVNPFIYSWGNTPLFNNQLSYQTSFAATKMQDRIGAGHGSVGITFEGVTK